MAGKCSLHRVSPVLSALPVLMAERAERRFLNSLPAALFLSFLFFRYVDNRLLLGPATVLQLPQRRASCDPNFYEGILLEKVSDDQWLGFTIDARARKASLNLATKPWRRRRRRRRSSRSRERRRTDSL